MNAPHVVSEPAILYFGTPVVLISTVNADGSFNIAPMSSAFWLGWRCILGLDASSKTTENIARTGELVLNLPSVDEADATDRLARLTGSHPVPDAKVARGYGHEARKFEIAGLTPVASETVAPPRALECPIQLEAVVAARHDLMEDLEVDDQWRGAITTFEVRIKRVHVCPDLLVPGDPNRVDPDRWNPLMMSFQKFYGLAPAQVRSSRLADIPEQSYLSSDVARAREG